MENINTKQCFFCLKAIRGRSDKRFCDDYCRQAYHVKIKKKLPQYIKTINQALMRNRKIMETIIELKEDPFIISRERLLEKGFAFKYHTHQYRKKTGNPYFFCYDYGYLDIGNEKYLIVKTEEMIM